MTYASSEAERAYHRRYYQEHKEQARIRQRITLKRQRAKITTLRIELKARPCMDCGGTFPPECMDFDHVRGVKRWKVSQASQASMPAFLAEVAKCDLVCANCHRIRTVQRARERVA